jgi:formiminoglutamase
MSQEWQASPSDLFFSKNDKNDPRLGEFARSVIATEIPNNSSFLLWGYPDDEGILLNGGRIGAAEGPAQIRRYLYRMTPGRENQKPLPILDLGNLSMTNSLPERHASAKRMAYVMTQTGLPWLSLGGGHDYGYSDGAGFLRSWIEKGQRPLVVNIDAHLDVRPADHGFNSGTPFRRLLEEFAGSFDFIEFGIQDQCNSAQHQEWAESQGAKIISLNEIRERGLKTLLQETSLWGPHRRPLWLSLDIDGLTSTEAPGCSQSWTRGLTTEEVFLMFKFFDQTFQWQALSIYEVSPPLDVAFQTSKLAALLAHRFYNLKSR